MRNISVSSSGVSHVFPSLNGGSHEKTGSFDFPGGSQFCGQIDHLGVGCPYSSSPPKWCRGSVLCPQVCKWHCDWIRLTFPAGLRLSPAPLPRPGALPELTEPFPSRPPGAQPLFTQHAEASFTAWNRVLPCCSCPVLHCWL